MFGLNLDGMYDVRDLGSYLCMLIVLPFFAVVFVLSLALVAPFLTLNETYRWLNARFIAWQLDREV